MLGSLWAARPVWEKQSLVLRLDRQEKQIRGSTVIGYPVFLLGEVAATVKEVLAGKHMESVLKSTREKAANLLLGEKGGATGGEASTPTTSTGCSGIT